MTPRQIKDFRQRLKVTQVQFAKFLSVAPNTVARWERGELGMRPSTERLLELLVQQTDLTKPTITEPTTTKPTTKRR